MAKLSGKLSRTNVAPAQSAIQFCLQPETFPVFLSWLRRAFEGTHPPEWFDEALIRRDLMIASDHIETIEDMIALIPPNILAAIQSGELKGVLGK